MFKPRMRHKSPYQTIPNTPPPTENQPKINFNISRVTLVQSHASDSAQCKAAETQTLLTTSQPLKAFKNSTNLKKQ